MAEFWRHPRDHGERIRWPGGSDQSLSGHFPKPPAPESAAGRILERYGFTCRMGHNVYEIVNAAGDVVEVPFDNPDWESACAALARDEEE